MIIMAFISLPVYSCNKFHIGKTRRDFKIRFKKQISEIKFKKTDLNSHFAKHVLFFL